ncbi:hypothetical protein CCR75_002539 [Bremia lactucae]|uniref:Plastocyanin-like domain-containing protein n=1 Tax=Bremia lactucae TaxID=4779 RepID=A0A976IFD6_BRELC|nr:hypothetical protein CCR75_002539 [Bremia lactucae]
MKQNAFGLRGPLILYAPESRKQDWEIDNNEKSSFNLQICTIDLPGRHVCGITCSLTIAVDTIAAPLLAITLPIVQMINRSRLFSFKLVPTYRLRLINVAVLAPVIFSIDDHGFPSELINSLTLNAGHRYDIVIETENPSGQEAIGPYWMRAVGLYGLPWTRGTAATAGKGFTYEGLAIVSYKTDYGVEPTSEMQQELTTIDEVEFTPLSRVVLSQMASDCAILLFKMEDGLGYFSIDGDDFHTFQHPSEAPLFSIANGLTNEELHKIEYGEHIEVVLVSIKDEQHPFHMHSHAPLVVGSGVVSLKQIRDNQLPPLQLEDSMTRDVYTVPPCTPDGPDGCLDAGYLVLRFTADSPGVWIFHCHIDWHLKAGLSMILVEAKRNYKSRGLNPF